MSWIGYAVLAYGLATWAFPVPLTLLHELGHALPALAFMRGQVVVSVGRQPARSTRLGRLEFVSAFSTIPAGAGSATSRRRKKPCLRDRLSSSPWEDLS